MAQALSDRFATKYTLTAARYLVYAIIIYLVAVFLAVMAKKFFGIQFVELEIGGGEKKETIQVDVASYLVIGAIQLIYLIISKLFIFAGLIIIWAVNFIFVGYEYKTEFQIRETNPIALFRLFGVKIDPISATTLVQASNGLDQIYSVFISAFAGLLGIPERAFENVWEMVAFRMAVKGAV